MEPINASFNVPFTYQVHFVRHVFAPSQCLLKNLLLAQPQPLPAKVLCVLDEGLAQANPSLSDAIMQWFKQHPELELVCEPTPIPGGETIKNDYRKLMQVVDQMLQFQLCRHSYVMALGGGALLDAVGLGTALVHRGLRFIRMPTTVLAQNDAGVGVKNSMNLHGGKNTIGTFAPPYAVINDFQLLDTLPKAHWIGGISEAFKVALIKDASFFTWLCEHAEALALRKTAPMETLIHQCAQLHVDHICSHGDPFETGTARPLDFGHWVAHKLESLSNYRITHGEAVAVGLVIDAHIANQRGLLPERALNQLHQALLTCGFNVTPPEVFLYDAEGTLAILRGLADFREHLGGELCITLPNGIGHQTQVNHIAPEEVERALTYLKKMWIPTK